MKSVLNWIYLNSEHVFSFSLMLEDNTEFKEIFPESSLLIKFSIHTKRAVSVPTFGHPYKVVTDDNKHGFIIYKQFEGIRNFNALCDELKSFALFRNLRSSYDVIGMTVTL